MEKEGERKEEKTIWEGIPQDYIYLLTKHLNLINEDNIVYSNLDLVSKFLETKKVPLEIVNSIHIIISKIKSERKKEEKNEKEPKKYSSPYPQNYPILKKNIDAFFYISKVKRFMKTFKVDKIYREILF